MTGGGLVKWRIAALDVVDWSVALDWARAHAGGGSLPAAIILAQIVLFARRLTRL